MTYDLCIYHAPCQDGFGAAWAVWKRWPDMEFAPGVYGAPPPDVADKHVLIVDFSYKADVLREMSARAKSITIIDHHKSAEGDLADFRTFSLDRPEAVAIDAADEGAWPIQAQFDMDKSGAVLAWEHCHGPRPIPLLLQHIQDRDLWRFEMPDTRAISQNLFSLPYDFDVWSAAAKALARGGTAYTAFVEAGEAIRRQLLKDVAELRRTCVRRMVIGGVSAPVANLPYVFASEAGNQMAEGEPFAATYFDNADGHRVFSLRSAEGGMDVAAIAEGYGGGGHKHASGFRRPLAWEGDAA